MDINQFKIQVRNFLAENPGLDLEDLRDYCESLIPGQLYPSHSWLIDQTVDWYKYMIKIDQAQSLLD